jgi:hypothetical protein
MINDLLGTNKKSGYHRAFSSGQKRIHPFQTLAKVPTPQANAEVVSWHIKQMSGDNHHAFLVEQAVGEFLDGDGAAPFGEGNGTGPGQVASKLVVVLLEESGGQGSVFADNELIAEGKADREARKLVARELGNQRINVTYSYIPKG